MTTTDRRWSDADRELVASHISDRAPSDAAADILDALAAAGRLADPMQQAGGAVIAAWSALLTEAQAEADRLRAEAVAFAAALEFGDNIADPAASLAEMIDPIQAAMSAARDHDECPTLCELCGETLAATVCQRCAGGGDIGSGAYSECPECAGAGRIHEGCAEASYADLVAERERFRARVAELEQSACCTRADGYECEVHPAELEQPTRRWTVADPTPVDPADIAAGAQAINRLGIAIGDHMRQVIAAAVLAAVLPDHDARVRDALAEEIAEQIIEMDRHVDCAAADFAETARAIARAHTTTGEEPT